MNYRAPGIQEDLEAVASGGAWERLRDKTILVTGANGSLPAYVVLSLLHLNETRGFGSHVIGLVRDQERAKRCFEDLIGRRDLELLCQDVCDPLPSGLSADYVIHGASQASPRYYGQDPVGTLSANTLGTHRLLEHARSQGHLDGFLFLSSCEIYGHVDGTMREDEYGPVDPADIRSCYAESKRLGETMCVCYSHQYRIPTRIARVFHTYGPSIRLDDGRVYADFVASVARGKDIELNSNGLAKRSFCYVTDAVRALLTLLLDGKDGEPYNVGNPFAEVTIRELAERLVRLYPQKGLTVRSREDPPEGYLPSGFSRQCPDIGKIEGLGWRPTVPIEEGFRRTIDVFLHASHS